MQNQQHLCQELNQSGVDFLRSFGTVSQEIDNQALSDAALLQLQTHCSAMARLAAKLRQHVAPDTDKGQTSNPAKANAAVDPHAEKLRFWRLSDRDFKIIVESFQPVKSRYDEALDAERRGVLTEDMLDALCNTAYHFDRVAHLVFELNLGFDEAMTHYKTDLDRVSVADLAPQFTAVAGHVAFLTEYQPTGKARTHDLQKLHQLSGIFATGSLRTMDDFEPRFWLPEPVANIAKQPVQEAAHG